MSLVKELLRLLAEDGASLTREQAAQMLGEILAGGVPEVETAALLAVLATRGEQAPELAGFVDVMRRHSTPMPFTDAERDELVDCVGTGGGGPQTFNISCGAALVAAAAGARVASMAIAQSLRAAARPMSSKLSAFHRTLSGAGRRMSPRNRLRVSLRATLSPAMKALGPLRRALGFRTIFNLVGPLTNPAHARTQVVGVLAPSRVSSSAAHSLLSEPGAPSSFTERTASTNSPPPASLLWPASRSRSRASPNSSRAHHAGDGRLPRATIDQFTGGDVATNKALLYDMITGVPGARRDVVLLNAAAYWLPQASPAI